MTAGKQVLIAMRTDVGTTVVTGVGDDRAVGVSLTVSAGVLRDPPSAGCEVVAVGRGVTAAADAAERQEGTCSAACVTSVGFV